MADEMKKIFIVDDNEVQLTIAKNALKNDFTIFTAKSGKEAIDYLLRGLSPNLILLDILMPKMDGWETFNRIRSINLFKDVPIIFLTSITEESQKKQAFEMGAADYIIKPYANKDLLNRVKNKLLV
jgi:CheY-like chemotaxis protein